MDEECGMMWEYLKNLQKDKAEETLLDGLCRALNSAVTGKVDVRGAVA